MMKSWRTTSGGIVSLLAGLLFVLGHYDIVKIPVFTDMSAALAAIGAGYAAIMARDNKVTSAQAGAEPKKPEDEKLSPTEENPAP